MLKEDVELEAYRNLKWPHSRCLSCSFPTPKDAHKSVLYTVCPQKGCTEIIKCPQPFCEGAQLKTCGMCKTRGADCCIQFECVDCNRPICKECKKKFDCGTCDGDWGDFYYCGDCTGPFKPFVFYYANNVKEPDRRMGCRRCYDYWSTSSQFSIVRDCETCALESKNGLPGKACIQKGCETRFCHHKDGERQLCNKHLSKKRTREMDSGEFKETKE